MNPGNRYNLRTHGSSHPVATQVSPLPTNSTTATSLTTTIATMSLPSSMASTQPSSSVVASSSHSITTTTVGTRPTVVPSAVFAPAPKHSIEPFSGINQDAKRWLTWYDRYCAYYRLALDADKMADFPFHLTDHARAWYDGITVPNTFTELRDLFEARFKRTNSMDFMAIKQAPSETVQNYFIRLGKCQPHDLNEAWVKDIAIRGLRDNLRTIVMPQNPQTLEETRKAAILAEETLALNCSAPVAQVQTSNFESIVLDQLAKLKLEVDQMRQAQPSPETAAGQGSHYQPPPYRQTRPRFQGRKPQYQQPQHYQQQQQQHYQQQQQHPHYQQQQQQHYQRQQQQHYQPQQQQHYQQPHHQQHQQSPRRPRPVRGNGKRFPQSSFQSNNQ